MFYKTSCVPISFRAFPCDFFICCLLILQSMCRSAKQRSELFSFIKWPFEYCDRISPIKLSNRFHTVGFFNYRQLLRVCAMQHYRTSGTHKWFWLHLSALYTANKSIPLCSACVTHCWRFIGANFGSFSLHRSKLLDHRDWITMPLHWSGDLTAMSILSMAQNNNKKKKQRIEIIRGETT